MVFRIRDYVQYPLRLCAITKNAIGLSGPAMLYLYPKVQSIHI